MFQCTGYHGTKTQNKESILANGFHWNQRDNHWLGQGIYFFSDIEQAKNWVTFGDLTVFEVKIEISQENYLDLDSIDGMEFFYEKSMEIIKNSKKTILMKEQDINANRCFLLDLIKKVYKKNLIKYTFQIKDPKYGNRNLQNLQGIVPLGLAYNQLQYCLNDETFIIEKKDVFSGTKLAKRKALY